MRRHSEQRQGAQRAGMDTFFRTQIRFCLLWPCAATHVFNPAHLPEGAPVPRINVQGRTRTWRVSGDWLKRPLSASGIAKAKANANAWRLLDGGPNVKAGIPI